MIAICCVFACRKERSNKRTSGAHQLAAAPQQGVALQQSHLGVKNFEQIFQSMMVLTGTERSGSMRKTFDAVKGQLPTDNEIEGFSGTNQLAIVDLAVDVCKNRLSGRFGVPKLPAKLENNAQSKRAYFVAMVSHFWRVPLDNSTYNTLDTLVRPFFDQNKTKEAKLALCTVMLSSSAVIFL